MDNDELTSVKCTIANIWTSRGQIFKGDTVKVSPEEAKILREAMKK